LVDAFDVLAAPLLVVCRQAVELGHSVIKPPFFLLLDTVTVPPLKKAEEDKSKVHDDNDKNDYHKAKAHLKK